jgi:MurNAc alpha-1-phosphate uridylyltransferase
MAPRIASAMVLAAGLGKRMRPLTSTIPKPLVEVGGKPLIDYALDRLEEAGIQTAVINVHHLADLLEAHVRRRRSPRIMISDERLQLLETGGGIRKALPLLGEGAFLALNSDSLWIEGPRPNLARLVAAWKPESMDILLLLAPSATSIGYDGAGDFAMAPDGRLSRRKEREIVPFVFAGAGIYKPELFCEAPDRPFSLNLLFDRAMEAGRLYGLRLDGQWLHVGTPDAIPAAEERLSASVR